MTYQVHYTDEVTAYLDDHIGWLFRENVSFETIDAWYGRLYTLIDSLDEMPLRFPVDEYESEKVGKETRKMNFGDYLVFYQVDADRRRVDIVAFMHGSKRGEV